MYATIEGKKFIENHAKQGTGGWVCKTTDAPIQQITVQHTTGSPAFEPGDLGVQNVDVQHLWCPKCGKKPDAKKLQGSHIAEMNLVRLH
ncbi:MAG: hypothetical protein PHD04_01280 [Candidatus Pacebacteria bacterium]|nr:hypothetical protein [Candidatus Paceibacterota bacterium]